MTLSKLGNIIQLNKQGIGSVWGFGGPAMFLCMALALKVLPSRDGNKCAHRCCALERHCPGQWGKEEGEQKLRVLSSVVSAPYLNYLSAAWKHFPPRDSHREMPLDMESMEKSWLDSSGSEPFSVLERTSLYGLHSLLGNTVVKADGF